MSATLANIACIQQQNINVCGIQEFFHSLMIPQSRFWIWLADNLVCVRGDGSLATIVIDYMAQPVWLLRLSSGM